MGSLESQRDPRQRRCRPTRGSTPAAGTHRPSSSTSFASQNYRYQPRDADVKPIYQAQPSQRAPQQAAPIATPWRRLRARDPPQASGWRRSTPTWPTPYQTAARPRAVDHPGAPDRRASRVLHRPRFSPRRLRPPAGEARRATGPCSAAAQRRRACAIEADTAAAPHSEAAARRLHDERQIPQGTARTRMAGQSIPAAGQEEQARRRDTVRANSSSRHGG